MLRLKKILESKQVSDIYHVCKLEDVVNYIVPNNTLLGSCRYYNSVFKSNDVISFTRDRNYIPAVIGTSSVIFQFMVDGNILSENHRIEPYNNKTKTLGFSEAEETVLGSIKNFKKYIKKVFFYVTKELINYLNDTRDIHSLMSDLWKVKNYLKGVDTEKVEKNNYLGGWMESYHYDDPDLEFLFKQNIKNSMTFTEFCKALQEFAN